jgi:K+-sensing histidine kinase KdpD
MEHITASRARFCRRYGIAVLSTGIALLVTQVFVTQYHQGIIFILLGAIMFSSWFGWRGPGLAASVMSTMGTVYLIVPSTFSLSAIDVRDVLRLSLFVAVALLIVKLTHRQQRAEDRLRVSERRYRLLFDQNPLPACIVDPRSLRVLEVNDALTKESGLPTCAAAFSHGPGHMDQHSTAPRPCRRTAVQR